MGLRLTQITTRTGDTGSTGLANNDRLPKSHIRIQTMGDVDELNSMLGVLMCEELLPSDQEFLIQIQHELFNLGGELSLPGVALLKESALLHLDQAIEQYQKSLPALKEFILPGGTKASCWAHVCRTVARRAERSAVALTQQDQYEGLGVKYLNRLSDVLFMLARKFNQDQSCPDVYWNSQRLAQMNNT